MTEYLVNMLNDYIVPIMKFGDCFINKDGHIQPVGSTTDVYKFENKRYTHDGKNGAQFSIPTIPFKDEDYIKIKQTEGFEVFNPFTNTKQMTILALLVKEKLIEYFFYDDKEDDNGADINDVMDDSFENEPISFYNTNELDGSLSVVFSNNKDPAHPKEIAKVTGIDINYMLWCLCIEAMKKCVKVPKQFDNPEKAWTHIMRSVKEWDRLRKKIAGVIEEEHETVLSAYSAEDDFEISNYTENDFVYEDDISDYLFSRFGQVIEDVGTNDIDDMNLSGRNTPLSISQGGNDSSLDEMVLMF